MSAKKKALQIGDKVLIPVGVAAAGGVAANQFPQNQKSSKKAREKVFKSDFANTMYRVVAKMDADEADLFTHLVTAAALEEMIEKNQRVLQRHVDEVAKRVIEDVKKRYLQSVAKNATESSVEYAKALATISKEIQWDPREHPRDRSGRFRTNVVSIPGKGALNNKQAAGRGIPAYDFGSGKNAQSNKARYHQEYQQVSQFLDAVAASGNPGDHNVTMRVVNQSGEMHDVHLNGKPQPGRDWDPKTESIVELDAHPASLTLGGASFGLSSALGRPISSGTVNTINRGDRNFTAFANQWGQIPDDHSSNSRLYNNVGALSTFVERTAPNGSGAQIAGRFGRMVSERGPEAEKVFGPHVRRTAYRYRGVTKEPDPDLVRQYEMAISRADAGRPSAEQAKARTAAFNRNVRRAIKEKAAATNTPEDAVQLTRAERAQIMASLPPEATRATSAEARGAGQAVLHDWAVNHVKDLKTGLYGLHLDAGNTPPSEGILVDKNGVIVSQAVGYGDDHYLPFDLKHLAKLRGGEYIRTRSVGGPTSEDIYTGLMAGANKVTVVSRSGTFTIDFHSDFKGGRRYNDKAARMVSRYQRLVDSIQSETVDRESVPPEIRNAIVDDVRANSEGFPPQEVRAEIQRRLDDYKANPDLSGPNAAALDRYIDVRTRGMDEAGRNRIASQLRAEANKDREFKYRLNGEGYGAALKALQEQFPYYIATDYKALGDEEGFRAEKDKGYVEPGRNRPTAARAGWHGTSTNKGNKFSASQADYQRGKYGTIAPIKRAEPTEETPAKEEGAAAPADQKASIAARVHEGIVQNDLENVALKIAEELRPAYNNIQGSPEDVRATQARLAPLGMEETALREYLKKPDNARKFDDMLKDPQLQALISTENKVAWQRATNQIGRKEFDPATALIKGKPPLWKGGAYDAGAAPEVINRELEKLDRTQPVSVDKKLSAMTDGELETELDALQRISEAIKMIRPEDTMGDKEQVLRSVGLGNTPGARALVSDPKAFAQTVENVQRVRAVNLNREGRETPVKVQHLPARQAGDETDHREQVRGGVDMLKRYRDNLRSRDKEVPEFLDVAISDGENTLKQQGPIHQADHDSWTGTDEYQEAIDHMQADMRGNTARRNW